jgi:hypothetical protein
MDDEPWMFEQWLSTHDMTECFDSANYPCEIASSPSVLEALLDNDLLTRIVEEGKVSQITCFDTFGYFDDHSRQPHHPRVPEKIKRLIVYKESALQYEAREM